ncbi:Verru_Chthon cassette protein A [Verrucomicrobiales bacterium]|nr:Verru_Chthon cassette protein A [Verrucomicrobiales bacterium]
MKIPKHLKSGRFLPKSRKGVALVTVLTVMSLTTILVMTFFSLATSEHKASNTYSHGVQAQQIGEQAVNMVIAQIREATTAGTTIAWASQPGAIRRWTNGSGDNEEFAFKLYSDEEMKTQDWNTFQEDFTDARNWSTMPAHYVDLNEPIIRGQKVYYPIVHPLAADEPAWPKAIGEDDAGVEGFSYNRRSGKTLSDGGEFGNKAAAVAGANGHVAMPVKWIYQLEDGTLGVMAGSGGSQAAYTFTPISGSGVANESNRIVARFAYWADDETSKLNINTHAGGLAWDVPKAGGAIDMDMGRFQPAQKEWQRYPGHPASVHLGPALAPGILDIVNDRDAMEMLYRVVPRVVGGGSQSGTRYIDTRLESEANGLVPDNEPLFPSLDDVVMRSDREPHEYPDAEGNPVPADKLSEYLERAKFFVTVNSRAPETNMFNLPKVAIWPIYDAAYTSGDYKTHLTPFDRLIHYCASMGQATGSQYPRHEYIFKRKDADSNSADYANIPRNRELYAYLEGLMGDNIPGYGGSFSSKYGADESRQILTQIFDYIRCTNLHDDSIYGADFGRAYQEENTADHITYTNPRNKKNKQVGMKGHGQVVPIEIGDSKGFGRFYSLGGVQVQVISCAEPGDAALPSHMGARSYRGRNDVQPSSQPIYMNFPPIPAGVPLLGEPGHTDANDPAWLTQLKMQDPVRYAAAFEPANWNWQLAYLDPQYFQSIVPLSGGTIGARTNDPGAVKFRRSSLSIASYMAGNTRLNQNEQLIQAVLLFNLFTPSIGWGSINPDMEIRLSIDGGFRFTSSGSGGFGASVPFIGFAQSASPNSWVFSTNATDTAWGGRRYGGLMPYEFLLNAPWGVTRTILNDYLGLGASNPSRHGGRGRFTYLDRGYERIPQALADSKYRDRANVGDPDRVANAYRYDLVTVPFKINGASGPPGSTIGAFNPGAVNFTGGDLTFEFFHGGDASEGSQAQNSDVGEDGGELVQTVTVNVPNFDFTDLTGPQKAPVVWNGSENYYTRSNGGYYNEFDILSKDSFSFLERNSLGMDPGNPVTTAKTRVSIQEEGMTNVAANGRFAHISVHARPSPFSRSDLVQSVELKHGDARIVAARKTVGADEVFARHRLYGDQPMAHSVTNAVGNDYDGATIESEYLILPNLPKVQGRAPYNNRAPLPFGVELSSEVQLYGDYDNGSGLMIDGPYINKPDEGNTHSLKTKYARELQGHWEERRNYGEFPYFNRDWLHESGGPAYFSPNRIVSGPGMFGSLPTGVVNDIPWRTLLFRPNTTGPAGFASHPGARNPPDHLIMDMFWMPVVEPYAISEPLSTGGKVNLNCELVPFLHIERNTALRGVFRSEFLLCVPNIWHVDYKHNHGRGRGYHWRDAPYDGKLQSKRLRATIVDDPTLDQFYTRFNNGQKAFKSSSEICEIHLIPEDLSSRLDDGSGDGGGGRSRGGIGTYTPSVAQMESGKYWQDHSLVGDNSRERPYTNIQNRVTTKSNTFKVHFRAQVLKQARRETAAEYGDWRPELDSVEAEYRGSSIVERFVDPNSDEIIDFVNNRGESLDSFYQFRVVNPRRFAP